MNTTNFRGDYHFYRQALAMPEVAARLPSNLMISWVDEFEALGYVDSFLFKKRTFRGTGVTAKLQCRTDFNCFRLIFSLEKSKEIFLEEVILDTEPEPLLYHHKFKDLEHRNGQIVVTMRYSDELLYAKAISEL